MIGRTLKRNISYLDKILISRIFDYPLIVAFELMAFCSLDCEYCIQKRIGWNENRKKIRMSFDDFRKIIDDIHWHVKRIAFNGGEPLLYSEIGKVFAYARKKRIETLVPTNGQFMENRLNDIIQNPCDVLVVAYEHPSENKSSYEHALKDLIKHRKVKPEIVLQMVVTKQSVDKIDQFWADCKRLKVDYGSIKSMGIWNEADEEYKQLMIDKYLLTKDQHELSQYNLKDGEIIFERKPGDCPAYDRRQVSIRSDGAISPCWPWHKGGKTFGNAISGNLSKIWRSKKYRQFRHKMKHEWADTLCRQCFMYGSVKDTRKI